MGAFDLFIAFLSRSNAITYFVLAWLSFYFIITIWIFIYRYFSMREKERDEEKYLNALLVNQGGYAFDLALSKCVNNQEEISKEKLDICVTRAEVEITKGLSLLSIISSTSPFIGLFGTVVSILDTFSQLGSGGGGSSLSVIAPAISEALVATAAGIFTAIPAYSAHIALKRKAYIYLQIINQQYKLLLKNRA